jgi:hypothetical protein
MSSIKNFAYVENNVVTNISVADESWSGEGWVQSDTAQIGYSYNEDLDAFIRPKCHPEATLDEVTCDWVCDNADHTVEVPK